MIGHLRSVRPSNKLTTDEIMALKVSMKFSRIEDADAALVDFVREPLPYEAGFLSGKAFLAYKKRGGAKRSPMPDVYVGAHAVVGRMNLLTRDAARYRTYFPALTIIAP